MASNLSRSCMLLALIVVRRLSPTAVDDKRKIVGFDKSLGCYIIGEFAAYRVLEAF